MLVLLAVAACGHFLLAVHADADPSTAGDRDWLPALRTCRKRGW